MSSSSAQNAPGWDPVKNPFPQARRADHVDVYKSKAHGQVKVPDPYRWLETPPSQSTETQKFSEAQAAYFSKYLEGYAPRDAFVKRLEQTFSYPRFSCPSLKYDGNFYYNYNSGLESQSRIFRASRKAIDDVQDTPGQQQQQQQDPPGEVFFDANRLSQDGTVALTILAFSHTGKYFCYGVSKSGSDCKCKARQDGVRESSAKLTRPSIDLCPLSNPQGSRCTSARRPSRSTQTPSSRTSQMQLKAASIAFQTR